MSEAHPNIAPRPLPLRLLEGLGRASWQLMRQSAEFFRFLGGVSYLFALTLRWIGRGLFHTDTRFRGNALAVQMIRVGVRSVPIILLVQVFIGIILALQLAPTLRGLRPDRTCG